VFGGKVVGCDHREYGFAQVEVIRLGAGHELADSLFEGFDGSLQVRDYILMHNVLLY
jgi:GMP synthase (glutamine-hydrolysing)